MIDKYADKSRNPGKKISFFREGKTVEELFKMGGLSKEQLDMFSQDHRLDGCSESCEVYK